MIKYFVSIVPIGIGQPFETLLSYVKKGSKYDVSEIIKTIFMTGGSKCKSSSTQGASPF